MPGLLLTDPGGMAGWVGLVTWLTADALLTMWSHAQPSVWHKIGIAGRIRSAFYAMPLTTQIMLCKYGPHSLLSQIVGQKKERIIAITNTCITKTK